MRAAAVHVGLILVLNRVRARGGERGTVLQIIDREELACGARRRVGHVRESDHLDVTRVAQGRVERLQFERDCSVGRRRDVRRVIQSN